MKTSIGSIVSVILLLASNAFGQGAIPPEMRSQVAMSQMARQGMGANSSNVVYGLAAPPGQVLGDVYLDTAWNVGTIQLQSGVMLERYNMRYDLKSEMMEIQTSMAIKLLDYKMIKSAAWVDKATTRYFVNAGGYKLDDTKLVGILEVLADGTKPLIRRTRLHVKQPDYVPALDVGSRDAKIFKKSGLYYADGVNLRALKNKKDIFEALADKGEQVEAYVKSNNLNLRTDLDVTRVFEYYHSLTVEKTEP